jgi:WD40 repeat protein
LSSDGSKLAVARWRNSYEVIAETWSLRVLDTTTGSVLLSEALEVGRGATYVRFSEDGRRLFYANTESDRHDRDSAGVIDIESGSVVHRLDREILVETNSNILMTGFRGGLLTRNGLRFAMFDGSAAYTRTVDFIDTDEDFVRIPPYTFGISDASFSSDGSMVLTSGGDGSTRVWNVETGAELLKLSHGRHVLHGRFSGDGSRILTACAGGSVRLWDARNGDLIALLTNGGGFELQFAFSPEGRRCATGGGDGAVRLWNSVTGEPLGQLISYPDLVSRIAFTLDGKRLVAASASEVLLSDAESAVTLARIDGKLLAISLEHNLIVVGGETFMQLRNTLDGSVAWALNRGMTHAVISPDGSRLLCWDEADGAIHDFDVVSGAPVGRFTRSHETLRLFRVSFNRDGSRVLISEYAEYDPDEDPPTFRVELCDAADGRLIEKFAIACELGESSRFKVIVNKAMRIAFSPDGLLFWNGNDVCRASDGSGFGITMPRECIVTGMEFSPDGSRLIVLGYHHRMGPVAQIYDARTGDQISRLIDGHPDSIVRPLQFDPTGERLLTVGDDGYGSKVRVWSVATGQELVVLRAAVEDAASILDMEAADASALLVREEGSPINAKDAKYSPDGSLILTRGDDGRTRLHDPVSGSVLVVLDAGTTAILAGAEFSPDSKTVLAACGDDSLRLWDASSGRQLAVMEGHDSKIDAFSFSADGQQIITVSGSTLRRWGPVEKAC